MTRAAPAAGDPFGVGRITALDLTLINAARAHVEAFDTQIDYRFETEQSGSFDFFTIATWQTHFEQQLLPTTPIVENVGITSSFPLKFRGNAGVTWNRGPWTLGWTARFFNSYGVSTNATILLNQGAARVPRQDYHDAFVQYRLGESVPVLSRAEVQLGIENIFDQKPPFDANNSAIGYYSPYGDPRLASYYLSLRLNF